jgi:hypothetical protein
MPPVNQQGRHWDSAPPVLSLRDVPELDNRRASGGSWISQENRIPSPRTPYSAGFFGGPNVGVISNEHLSPYGYAPSTPSPLSTGALALTKPFADSRYTPAALSAILKKEPAIPEPTMAANPKQLPVEESLDNPNAHTNVYIKGLAPETTDEMLEIWAARFGEVHSTKSIIDTASKLCKGCVLRTLMPRASAHMHIGMALLVSIPLAKPSTVSLLFVMEAMKPALQR